MATVARAEEAAWYWLIEPRFMRPELAEAIPGATATVVTPGLVRGENVTYLTKAEAERLKIDLASARRVARANADAALAALRTEYVRDRNGVVLYARLDSDRPIVAAAVLAPKFAETFEKTLGPDPLVTVPNRHRAYVYPALDAPINATADLVRRDYDLSPCPVSKEVFRVTREGIRAEGTLDERR